MSTWIGNTFRAGAELAEAQIALLRFRLRLAAILAIVVVVVIGAGGLAVLGVLAAAVLALEPLVGLPLSLLSVSLVTLCGTLCLVLIAIRPWRRAAAEAEATRAKERLAELVSPTSQSADSTATFSNGTGHGAATRNGAPPVRMPAALAAALSNPTLIVSAAFATVSIFGVRRTIGLARTAAAAARVGSLLSRATTDKPDASPDDGDVLLNRGDSTRDGEA